MSNIKLDDTQKLDLYKAYHQLVSCDKYRSREHEECFGEERNRDDYQRDYARILYSSSFRRLQGKMQILGIEFEGFFRNRLTHSLEVSQIAKSIAGKIRDCINKDMYGRDQYVLEAAAIAHDIGHPAFGHSGERVLSELAGGTGGIGFEGNAQNFRVLRTIERKLPTDRGLNLTYRTLLSILKYNVPYPKSTKKFLYQDDFEFFERVIESCGSVYRTLDVQVIDLADEIAYAAHDLEDALSMKYFNIDELAYEFSQEPTICDGCKELLEELIREAKDIAKKCNVKTAKEYSQVFKKEMTSRLVDKLICDITLIEVNDKTREKTGTTNEYELGFGTCSDLASGLKRLTFRCVNQEQNVLIYEKKGEIIIRGLYKLLMDEEINKDFILLPPEYRPAAKATDDQVKRNVLDYIAGMMDSYAISLYERYFGKKFCDITFES